MLFEPHGTWWNDCVLEWWWWWWWWWSLSCVANGRYWMLIHGICLNSLEWYGFWTTIHYIHCFDLHINYIQVFLSLQLSPGIFSDATADSPYFIKEGKTKHHIENDLLLDSLPKLSTDVTYFFVAMDLESLKEKMSILLKYICRVDVYLHNHWFRNSTGCFHT